MKTPDMKGPEMAELDRQTGEVLSPWFASETVSPPPPDIIAGVQSRVQTTDRRAGWRIPDRWLWRRGDTGRTSFVLATATGVLVLALTGVTSVGVFLMANTGGSGQGQLAAGAASDDPAEGSGNPVAATPETAAVQATTAATVEPDPVEPVVVPMGETVATMVSGSVTLAPTIDDAGSDETTPAGATAVSDVRTTTTVEFDDARLSGLQRVRRNELRFGAEDGGIVAAGSISIENDGGTWSGTFESATPPGRAGALRAAKLTGEGDYDGLLALLHYDLSKDVGDPAMITGVVIPGGLPDRPTREQLEDYSTVHGEDRVKTEQREPGNSDRQDLPAVVAGPMDMTIEWISDYVDPEETTSAMTTAEFTSTTLDLGDLRLEMPAYELLLNNRYVGNEFEDNSSTFVGRSRGWSEDGGAWRGLVRGFSDPGAEWQTGRHMVTELTGSGAYEGLSALLFNTPVPGDPAAEPADENDLSAEWDEFLDSWSVEGMLFVGALPQYPEAP